MAFAQEAPNSDFEKFCLQQDQRAASKDTTVGAVAGFLGTSKDSAVKIIGRLYDVITNDAIIGSLELALNVANATGAWDNPMVQDALKQVGMTTDFAKEQAGNAIVFLRGIQPGKQIEPGSKLEDNIYQFLRPQGVPDDQVQIGIGLINGFGGLNGFIDWLAGEEVNGEVIINWARLGSAIANSGVDASQAKLFLDKVVVNGPLQFLLNDQTLNDLTQALEGGEGNVDTILNAETYIKQCEKLKNGGTTSPETAAPTAEPETSAPTTSKPAPTEKPSTSNPAPTTEPTAEPEPTDEETIRKPKPAPVSNAQTRTRVLRDIKSQDLRHPSVQYSTEKAALVGANTLLEDGQFAGDKDLADALNNLAYAIETGDEDMMNEAIAYISSVTGLTPEELAESGILINGMSQTEEAEATEEQDEDQTIVVEDERTDVESEDEADDQDEDATVVKTTEREMLASTGAPVGAIAFAALGLIGAAGGAGAIRNRK